jgi:curved DNA-binding protein CbpA
MHSFKEHLLEMTTPEAEELFGLTGDYKEADVKKAYKVMSSKHHPDKGGDVEKMKDVNKAWDLLKGQAKSGTLNLKKQREDRAEKYRQKAKDVAADISNKFDLDAFKTYFKEQIGQDFISEVTVVDGTDLGQNSYKLATPSYAGIQVKFYTKDKKVAFDFDALAYLYGEKNTKGLSNSETISYTIQVVAYGYANRKKQKMSARDWKHQNDHILLSDPKKSFPLAKMKKIAAGSSGVMKKADFMLAVKKELDGERWNDDAYMIPLKDGHILIGRSVFMRVPHWSTSQIGVRAGKYSFKKEAIVYHSFPENEDTLELFLSWKKMTMKQVQKSIEKIKKEK